MYRLKNLVKTSNCNSYRNITRVRYHSRTLHQNDSSSWRVAEAYAGKSVFITGGTGFLGKVLIESLLYNCRDINKIYVLIRQKKGMSSDQRLKQMIGIPLFSRLRSMRPQEMNKVVAIEGDLLDAELGIKPADQRELEEKVSIVLHSAALVKFSSSLKRVMEANYEGTRKVLNLGKRIKNLEAVAQMVLKIAFAKLRHKDGKSQVIAITPAPVPFNWNTGMQHYCLTAEIGDSFNPYTLSKRLTESLVVEERGDMPTIIIRPSGVTPMYKEPLQGWVDTWIAGSAFLSDVSRGLVSVAYGNNDVITSFVPVDYVCNLIIAAAARGNGTKDVIVYNACTSCTNPMTWKNSSDLFMEAKLKNDPDMNDLRPKKLILVESALMVTILTIIRDVIPAFFADVSLRINGQTPRASPHNNLSSWRISDAYAGKSVFVTGGTGFLGKVLIESLLYNCRDINKIYVLIRQKKGVNSDQRLKQMLDIQLFSRLRTVRPQDMNKVVAIEGDLLDAELGIKPVDRRELEEKVSVVLHSAAVVKFTNTLKNAMEANYEGTRKVLNLGKRMKNLETFVYISTAFAHLEKDIVEEKLYPNPIKIEKVHRAMQTGRGDLTEINNIIGGCFNTYTLSKRLTETLVAEERGDMSTIIIRPSGVTAMSKEPLQGWLDSWIGGPALLSDVSRGLISVAYGSDKVVASLLPVDYICNLIIAAAARGNRTKDVLVYNACTSFTNPITWKHFSDLFTEAKLKNYPNSDDLKPKQVLMVESPLIVTILTVIRDVIPAFFADVYLRIIGETPRYMQLQKRAIKLRDFLQPLAQKTLLVSSTRAQALAQSLHEEDKVRFPCDTSKIVWKEYTITLQRGIQKFMLGKQ